jgi:NAD(P)H-flavin reductase
MLEQVTRLSQATRVHLFVGARSAESLYDLPALEKMAAEHPWLTVVPAVSAGRLAGQTGALADVVTRYGDWSRHDAYLAGPTEMVQDCAARLTAAGMPAAQIHVEDFGWSEP